jgi:hypothetical protein
MLPSDYHQRVYRHVEGFFANHEVRPRAFDRGPIQNVMPGFHAIEVLPSRFPDAPAA